MALGRLHSGLKKESDTLGVARKGIPEGSAGASRRREGRGRAEVYKSAGLSRAQSLRQQSLWGVGGGSLSRSWGQGEGRERRRRSWPSGSSVGRRAKEVSGSCQTLH